MGDAPPAIDDPTHVIRPIPSRPWPRIAIMALLIGLALLGGWEAFWRSWDYLPGDYKNSESRWAQERRRAVGEATVLIGSSRMLFNVDLGVWEQASGGARPIQLGLEGTSPRAFLTDLANDENFTGLVIADVNTFSFFNSRGGRREDVLKYVRDQIPSQRIGHRLTVPFERVIGFIDDQTRPKEIWFNQVLPLRPEMKRRQDPYKLYVMAPDRDAELWSRVEDDAAYRAEAIRIWNTQPRPPPPPKAKVDRVIAEVRADIEKIRARGGDVAFVQFPYAGRFTKIEDQYGRARFWDRLIAETGVAGVNFQDHPQLQGFVLPEDSHLTARDSETYTRALVPLLRAEIARRAALRSTPPSAASS